MFAILKNNIVITWFVGTLEECEKKWKNYEKVEMTELNSPAYVGSAWDGTKFVSPELVRN